MFPKNTSIIDILRELLVKSEGDITWFSEEMGDHGIERCDLAMLLLAVAAWKPKTFPERESDEFDAGYAEAIRDIQALLTQHII